MFGSKVFFLSATVALSACCVATIQEVPTQGRIQAPEEDAKAAASPNHKCIEGWTPMSVEGVEGVFCVEGQACVANIEGACPGPQPGLEYGSTCCTVISGVKGCKPN